MKRPGAEAVAGPPGPATLQHHPWAAFAQPEGRHGETPQGLAYSFTRSRLPISPTRPRRKTSTQATKMTPWMTVTQAPISAR